MCLLVFLSSKIHCHFKTIQTKKKKKYKRPNWKCFKMKRERWNSKQGKKYIDLVKQVLWIVSWYKLLVWNMRPIERPLEGLLLLKYLTFLNGLSCHRQPNRDSSHTSHLYLLSFVWGWDFPFSTREQITSCSLYPNTYLSSSTPFWQKANVMTEGMGGAWLVFLKCLLCPRSQVCVLRMV